MPPLSPFNRNCLALAIGQAIALPTQAATIIVDSSADDETGCTLREAITTANTDDNSGTNGCARAGVAGPDMINFNSTVSDNTTIMYGGGIYSKYSYFNILKSTIFKNTADVRGGGMFARNTDTVIISNSTISSNSATNQAGLVIWNGGTATLVHTTIANNKQTNSGTGAGLDVSLNASATLANTLLADNTSTGTDQDCRRSSANGAVVTDNGGNLVENDFGSTNDCGNFAIEGQDPMLGSLVNNGGPTQTHGLTKGSPALNTAINTECGTGKTIDTDQRGEPRDDGLCDIGAFEGFIEDDSCYTIRGNHGKSVVFCL